MAASACDDFLERLGNIVGPAHVLRESDDMAPYLVEERGLYRGRALGVVRPGATQEVSQVLALASQSKICVVPQGGNTGLVGGQIPLSDRKSIVLSLKRMDRVRDVDPVGHCMVVEAGLTLLRAQEIAQEANQMFPLSIASEGSATIGGVLSANAGGLTALAYGVARDLVLGVEAVLADGRIVNALTKLRKDNTGYDLKHLFMGSEGTLGIITAAALKLYPQLRARATAMVAVSSPAQALSLLELFQARVGENLKTFELMPRVGLEFVLRHGAGARDPFNAPSPWYCLAEIASPQLRAMDEELEVILGEAMEQDYVQDAVVAASLDQRAALWRLRELMSEMQKYEGGSIKHDVSVPVSVIPEFLRQADAAILKAIPGVRIVAFGHMGDGNIHYNLSQPVGADKDAFLARWSDANAVVHAVVAQFSGSISAEHGIGWMKRDLLAQTKDRNALAAMRAIKAALDPDGILNPGKIL